MKSQKELKWIAGAAVGGLLLSWPIRRWWLRYRIERNLQREGERLYWECELEMIQQIEQQKTGNVPMPPG
jgi:hypothetical protein